MAFDNSFTAVTGAALAAGDWNVAVKGNFTASWVGTTGGDIDYYSSATAKSRLPKPSVDSVLKNTIAGVPSWLGMNLIPGILHTKGIVSSATQVSTNSTTFVDVTNMTFNLTLTTPCTIFALAFGASRTDDGIYVPNFSINIDGTDESTALTSHRNPDFTAPFPFVIANYRTGILAGTRTVKLRYKINDATDAIFFQNGRLIALAFAE